MPDCAAFGPTASQAPDCACSLRSCVSPNRRALRGIRNIAVGARTRYGVTSDRERSHVQVKQQRRAPPPNLAFKRTHTGGGGPTCFSSITRAGVRRLTKALG